MTLVPLERVLAGDVPDLERAPEPEAREEAPAPEPDDPLPVDRPVVKRAAAQVLAFLERDDPGEGFEGASADDVLREALGPCRGLDDLCEWARLARRALRRARKLRGEPVGSERPVTPPARRRASAIRRYGRRPDGSFGPLG